MSSLTGCPAVLHTVPVSNHVVRTQAGDIEAPIYIACIELLAVQGSQGWVLMAEHVPIYTGFITAGAVDLLGLDCLRFWGASASLHQFLC